MGHWCKQGHQWCRAHGGVGVYGGISTPGHQWCKAHGGNRGVGLTGACVYIYRGISGVWLMRASAIGLMGGINLGHQAHVYRGISGVGLGGGGASVV